VVLLVLEVVVDTGVVVVLHQEVVDLQQAVVVLGMLLAL
jgi:hypothetical protein